MADKKARAPKAPAGTRRVFKTVAIDTLKKEFFVRLALDQDHVLYLAALIEAGVQLPAIIVTKDGRIIDGRHRVAAYELMGVLMVEAEIVEYGSKMEEVAAAITANIGGSLPPGQNDLVHAIETMVQEGAGMKRLRELISIAAMPTSMLRKYYQHATSAFSRHKITAAMNAIAGGDLTVKQAAEEYKVEVESLKTAMQGKRKKASHLGTLKMQISKRTRSMSMYNRAIVQRVFDEYSDGRVADAYVFEVLGALRQSARRVQKYVDDCYARFTELQERTAVSGTKAKAAKAT